MSIGRAKASTYEYDAVVVGAGPNGLAAVITLAREGISVLLVEAAETIGGGTRSAEVTLPGFVHDVCSAIHPLAAYPSRSTGWSGYTLPLHSRTHWTTALRQSSNAPSRPPAEPWAKMRKLIASW